MKNDLRINNVTYFFWWCSGVEIELLKQLPTEKNKYIGIGGTIFGTWILATISGSYAFYITFKNIYLSIFFGIIWGLIIFNLDRYITASMKKRSDELENYFLSEKLYQFILELIPAIPRIAIALLIGLVISKPIELKLFESEIATEININKENLLEEKRKTLKEYDNEIDKINNEIKRLEKKLSDEEKEVNKLRDKYLNELDGVGSGEKGYGPIAKRKEEEHKRAKEKYNENERKIDNKIAKYDEEIEKLKYRKEKSLNDFEEKSSIEGLLIKIKSLSDLIDQHFSNLFNRICTHYC